MYIFNRSDSVLTESHVILIALAGIDIVNAHQVLGVVAKSSVPEIMNCWS